MERLARALLGAEVDAHFHGCRPQPLAPAVWLLFCSGWLCGAGCGWRCAEAAWARRRACDWHGWRRGSPLAQRSPLRGSYFSAVGRAPPTNVSCSLTSLLPSRMDASPAPRGRGAAIDCSRARMGCGCLPWFCGVSEIAGCASKLSEDAGAGPERLLEACRARSSASSVECVVSRRTNSACPLRAPVAIV